MSALSGFPKAANGSIVTISDAPTSFFRAMGVQGDVLCVGGTFPNGVSNGSVASTAVSNRVMHSTVAAIDNYVAGLPVDVNGAICTEVGAAVTFDQGVGFTAAGRVAIT